MWCYIVIDDCGEILKVFDTHEKAKQFCKDNEIDVSCYIIEEYEIE